ncbi:MAG: glycosyltransferase family 2 protein [Marinilabiliaceae bacterium]|nr:glycosyltransferase family 2 protein [Marinilabiliaceae bacterium]
MLNPKVSVIIPVYNLGEFLIRRCLDSCINQSYVNIELVVVNDGSTDNSPQIIEQYVANDSRIIAVHKKNEGLPFARKTGMEKATGNYFFHLDGDDSIPDDIICKMVQLAIDHSSDLVVGNRLLFQDGMVYKEYVYDVFGVGSGLEFLEFVLEKKLHYITGMLISRNIFAENFIDIKKEVSLGEDQYQLYQLCLFVKKAVSTNFVTYNYFINSESISQKKVDKKLFAKNQELYAHSVYELLSRFQYSTKVIYHLRLRILRALYLALHSSGSYVYDRKGSRKIVKNILKDILTDKSYKYFNKSFFLRCVVCLFLPFIPYFLKRNETRL